MLLFKHTGVLLTFHFDTIQDFILAHKNTILGTQAGTGNSFLSENVIMRCRYITPITQRHLPLHHNKLVSCQTRLLLSPSLLSVSATAVSNPCKSRSLQILNTAMCTLPNHRLCLADAWYNICLSDFDTQTLYTLMQLTPTPPPA